MSEVPHPSLQQTGGAGGGGVRGGDHAVRRPQQPQEVLHGVKPHEAKGACKVLKAQAAPGAIVTVSARRMQTHDL
ncbi:MAG TPA: hypothetical protein VK824_05715 [Planctomycetota bacterium]|nr:hypothetical protein [Planctomycetota bacterium]